LSPSAPVLVRYCFTLNFKLRPLDAGEGLKRRAGGAAAVRAVAIHCVAELIGHGVEDGTAIARARESAGGGVLQIGHWLVTLISLVAPLQNTAFPNPWDNSVTLIYGGY
jgi:hypothetical protein